MKKMNRMKTAKTIFVTALLVVGALFTSCNKDDNDPSIIGTWKTTSSIEEHFKDGVSQGKDPNSINATNYFIITFKGDGTFSDIDVSPSETINDTGTYSINGNNLVITYQGDTPNSFTFTLTDNTLVVVYTDEDIDGGGVKHKDVTTTTLARQ